MSKASFEIEPGGENTQYEGSNTFTQSHAKESGQFKDTNPTEASQQAQAEKAARGEKTAENVRYGEAISEHGFGGETVDNFGEANQGSGFGELKREEDGDGKGQTRREQGYGGDSGVGG